MHLHVHINLGDGAREEVKLGDGQAAKRLLELALKWGPVVALLFGVKLPPLPDLASEIKVTAQGE